MAMSKVAVLGVPEKDGIVSYIAFRGGKQAVGATVGKALDALTEQMPLSESMVVIVQKFQPDAFFEARDQQRLNELMQRWRAAQTTNAEFSAFEREELEKLVERELKASGHRAAALTENLE
jgi:hypothetical protein